MDRVADWVMAVPPVTRYWSLLIVSVGVYSSLSSEKKMVMLFLPDKAFGKQPWRLVTGFCYFGDFSIELIINMILSLRAVRYLEESFYCDQSLFPPMLLNRLSPNQRTKIIAVKERYQSLDFLYFLVQLCTSILVLVTYGFYKFKYKILSPGMILDDTLLYIWCRLNPNVIVPLFGFLNLRITYLPLIYLVIRSILETRFLQDLQRLAVLDLSVFTTMFAWRHIIAYSVGHFWWFTRYFLLPKLYSEANKLKSDIRSKTLNQYKINANRSNVIPDLLRLVILPPWYWIMIIRMQYGRDHV